MKNCTHCGKSNPDDFDYCRYCGAGLGQAKGVRTSWYRRLPSWVWILIIAGGVILAMGLIIGSFYAIATVEGVATLVLLLAGAVGFGVMPLRKPENPGPVFRAIGLCFFALMGASVDQTGNYLFNKPVEVCFCDNGTHLSRASDVSNPLPGSTYIQQDFTCYDENAVPVKNINIFAVLGIRFFEYVIIGYLLLALRSGLWNYKNKNT